MWYETNSMNLTTTDDTLSNLFEIKPSKGDMKRLEIIQATIECLATIGFEKTTYESIAKVVGTRRAHINYYFSDKNDIFKECVKYIVTNYQQTSLKHIQKAQTPEQMLLHFVEGPYVWAKSEPKQLTVMLLFYYLCNISEEYKELHDEIRGNGAKRLVYILHEKMGLTKKRATFLSKVIQNSISGYILDAGTTSLTTLEKAEKDNLKFVSELIELEN